MPRVAKAKSSSKDSTAKLGFEAKLWLTADKLRNNMDAADSSCARKPTKGSAQGEHGRVHQFYTPSCVVRCLDEMLSPNTSLRSSAFIQSEALPQVVSAAKGVERSGNFVKSHVRNSRKLAA